MQVKQNKLPKSEIELEFELTAEEFQEHFRHALLHLKSHVKMDGFRQGQAPDKMIEEKIGQENLLMEAGDHAVKHVYTDYILANNIEPVGHPEVQIVKIAKGSPFIFKAKITVLPEIQLPDYKEISGKIKAKEIAVTEEEIQDALNYLQKSRAKLTLEDRPAEKKDFVEIKYQNKDINAGKEIGDRFILGESGLMKDFEDKLLGMKAGEEKDFKAKFPENPERKDLAGKEGDFHVKMMGVHKMEIPEINDNFAQTLGAFDTLVALKKNLNEGILMEKQEAEKQRKRGEILEKIAEKTDFEIPEKLVEYEKDRLFEDMKAHIAGSFKISFEDYLASVKKTEQEIKDSFKKEAEKRIKNFLVLRQIGKNEKVEVSEEEIEEEVTKTIKNYSKSDLDKIDIEQLKEYTKGAIYNEKVFQKLETFTD